MSLGIEAKHTNLVSDKLIGVKEANKKFDILKISCKQ